MINTPANLALLKDRRIKLDQKPFDWTAWKKGTLLVLRNTFGEESAYYEQLNTTEYEYSSWSLRDTSGSGDPVKSACAELIDLCILDIQTRDVSNVSSKELLISTLQKYLPASTLTEINEILSSNETPFQKEANLLQLLSGTENTIITKALVELISEFYK